MLWNIHVSETRKEHFRKSCGFLKKPLGILEANFGGLAFLFFLVHLVWTNHVQSLKKYK
jgi:hypothetical protein